MDEIYYSVAWNCSTQIKVEGSKFLADVFPIDSEEEAEKYLQGIRKKYYAATHHCFAYAIGFERTIARSSDDGEPSGTAGVKILSAMQSKNLSDLIVIVTRYFGGIKLGVGGLGRAYFDAAKEGLNQAAIIKKSLMQALQVRFPFEETNAVMNTINTFKLKIENTSYESERTIISLLVKLSVMNDVCNVITNVTRGNIEIQIVGEKVVSL